MTEHGSRAGLSLQIRGFVNGVGQGCWTVFDVKGYEMLVLDPAKLFQGFLRLSRSGGLGCEGEKLFGTVGVDTHME